MEVSKEKPIVVEPFGGEETGISTFIFSTLLGNITAIQILSDSDTIITGCEDGAVRSWSISKRKCIQELDHAHTGT